jgi:general secretion pathway protein G
MVKLLSSRLAGQPITPFERGIVAFVIAMVAVTILHAWMSNLLKSNKQAIHAAREAVLREDCKVVHAAIDDYTVDKGNAPRSLDDVIQAGYLKALPAGFFLEACK